MTTIYERRLEAGITGKRLAEIAGIAHSALVHMEQGKPVQRGTFEKACQALGVSPDEIEGVKIFDPLRDRKIKRLKARG